MKKGCLWAVGIIVGLGVIGALADPPGEQPDTTAAVAADDAAGDMAVASTTGSEDYRSNVVASAAAEPATPSLTGPQRNAVRSAEQYISMSGFSRAGLIKQLSSSAGEGYDQADATAAVDSLNVDWNTQAVRSAQQYLNMMGFSCNGLIEQLSSGAGESYTASEARYGAEQAGAC